MNRDFFSWINKLFLFLQLDSVFFYGFSFKSLSQFSNKKILSGHLCVFFRSFFPVFTRQIARYHPHKNRKTSSKENLKTDPSKIQTGSKHFMAFNRYIFRFLSLEKVEILMISDAVFFICACLLSFIYKSNK